MVLPSTKPAVAERTTRDNFENGNRGKDKPNQKNKLHILAMLCITKPAGPSKLLDRGWKSNK
jgi:hypothetical protein